MKIQEDDYPEISFEIFEHLINVWKYKGKNSFIHESQTITFHSFQTLNYGNWLNDEIMSEYAKMLNKKLKINKKKIRILNSLFYPVFSKN